MQHWPAFATNALSNEAFLEGLARCKEADLCQAVGVSNFNEERLRKSARTLGNRGISLASNQIQYSLLYRKPETNGVLEACREYGVTPVAYSPLNQGVLTGKYSTSNPPPGARGFLYNNSRLEQVQELLDLVKEVGDRHGKNMAEVSINWCLCKGTLPIPGVKRPSHVVAAAGACGWRLEEGEILELDKVSLKAGNSTGAPFENW